VQQEQMKKVYSYIVTHDTGFAPNPFWGFCTLACCKPIIRRVANLDDIIIGLSSKTLKDKPHHLIYAMKINKSPMTYNEYYENFIDKRPVLDNERKKFLGDNIYFNKIQFGKHHNTEVAKNRDLSTDRVLISSEFAYFGREMKNIDEIDNLDLFDNSIRPQIVSGRGHRVVKDERIYRIIENLINKNFNVCHLPSVWNDDENNTK
jgi:hypothetical protein